MNYIGVENGTSGQILVVHMLRPTSTEISFTFKNQGSYLSGVRYYVAGTNIILNNGRSIGSWYEWPYGSGSGYASMTDDLRIENPRGKWFRRSSSNIKYLMIMEAQNSGANYNLSNAYSGIGITNTRTISEPNLWASNTQGSSTGTTANLSSVFSLYSCLRTVCNVAVDNKYIYRRKYYPSNEIYYDDPLAHLVYYTFAINPIASAILEFW